MPNLEATLIILIRIIHIITECPSPHNFCHNTSNMKWHMNTLPELTDEIPAICFVSIHHWMTPNDRYHQHNKFYFFLSKWVCFINIHCPEWSNCEGIGCCYSVRRHEFCGADLIIGFWYRKECRGAKSKIIAFLSLFHLEELQDHVECSVFRQYFQSCKSWKKTISARWHYNCFIKTSYIFMRWRKTIDESHWYYHLCTKNPHCILIWSFTSKSGMLYKIVWGWLLGLVTHPFFTHLLFGRQVQLC